MNISTRTVEGNATLALDDRFDAHEVGAFRAAVDPVVKPGAEVRLDLAAVRFIDSTALAELLRARSALQQVDGQLILDPVSDPVRVILELTGLDSVFAVSTPTGSNHG